MSKAAREAWDKLSVAGVRGSLASDGAFVAIIDTAHAPFAANVGRLVEAVDAPHDDGYWSRLNDAVRAVKEEMKP